MNLKVLVGRCWQGKKRQILGFLLLCVEKKDRPGNGQQTTNDVGGNVVLQNMVVGCRVCAGVDEGGVEELTCSVGLQLVHSTKSSVDSPVYHNVHSSI